MTRLIKENVERIANNEEKVKKLLSLGYKVLEEPLKEEKPKEESPKEEPPKRKEKGDKQ